MFGSLLYSSPPQLKMTRSSPLGLSLTCLSGLAMVKKLMRRNFSHQPLLWDSQRHALHLQFSVEAGFCLCWVNCGSLLLHSDLFSMLAPKKICCWVYHPLTVPQPQPWLLPGMGALANQTEGSKKVPWECVEKYLLFPERYLFCT